MAEPQVPVSDVPIRPAATVVLVRDGDAGLEVLLLRRHGGLAFHGGAWVFPGGRVDDADHGPAGPPADAADPGHERAARAAAVREAQEEADLLLDGDALVPFSHWTTPPGPPRRFATWFFLGHAGEGVVATDGGEITDHAWRTPAAALAAQAAGEVELPPPTFVSLTRLAAVPTADAALEEARSGPYDVFEPRLIPVEGGMASLYEGDVAYGDPGRLDDPGPRHRLLMVEAGWRYERT